MSRGSGSRLRHLVVISMVVAMVLTAANLAFLPHSTETVGIGEEVVQNNSPGGLPIPADGSCYHSAGMIHSYGTGNITEDMSMQIGGLATMLGKGQSILIDVWGDHWEEEEMFWQLEHFKPLVDSGQISAVGVNIIPTTAELGVDDDTTIVGIANGSFDGFIRAQAIMLKEFGHPVMVRFGAEFNINQGSELSSWSYSYARDPAVFKQAWVHYVDVLRWENVTNAIFVWNINFEDLGPHHWDEYYPGDGYVDWVGVDLYQYNPDSDPYAMMKGVCEDYGSRKPIAIMEWGANWAGQNYSDSDRAKFIGRFFDAVESFSSVKMINYWFFTDFKFSEEEQPLMTSAFAERLSDARYLGK